MLKFCKTLFFVLMLAISTSVYAQNITLKVENQPLGQIIDQISQQSGKTFAFSNELDIKEVKASLDVNAQPLEKCLATLLEPLKINYVIKGNQVLLRPAAETTSVEGTNKELSIYGQVTDKDTGEPVPGVVVTVKNKKNHYETTDRGGYYKINVSPNDVLTFSSIGYKELQVRASNSGALNIALEFDTIALENVVVTGYQTLSRERATGSFSVITSDDLQKRITPNLIDRIDGVTSGLMIDKDNNIVIRGVGTLYGNTAPLIVLDGFPIEGDLSTINPEDVESITVLKDASAASIWGTRAANGVIVITSKEGKANKGVQVDASYYATISMKPNVEDLHMMDSGEKLDFYYNHLVLKNSISPSYTNINYAFDAQGTYRDYSISFDPFREALGRWKSTKLPDSERYTEEQFMAEFNRLKGIDGYQQFTDYLLRNSFTNSANVSIKHNNEVNSLVASFSYDGENGTSKGNKSDRFIFNLRDKIKFWKRLELDLTANIIYQNSENNGLSSSYFNAWSSTMEPFQAIVNPDGSRAYSYNANIFSKAYHESMGLNYTYNPIEQMENNDITTKSLSTRVQGALTYNIIDGLSISTQYQYERNYMINRDYQSTNNPNWRNILNDFYDGSKYLSIPYGGYLTKSTSETSAWTWRSMASFNKGFNNDKHLVTAVAGYEMRKSYYENNAFSLLGYDEQTASGVIWDQYAYESAGTALARNGQYYNSGFYGPGIPYVNLSDTREVAYFVNASYIFDNKYTISGSFRLDQASLFGFTKDARNNYLWSAGASWNAKKENFIKDASWVDRLMVRLTYGVNGNRPLPQYTAYMVGDVSQMDPRIGPAGTKLISISNPANQGLKSEKVYTLNLGVDFAFWNSRLHGTLELYNKDSKDLIGPRGLDPSTGWGSSMINYASMNNKGIELLLTAVPIQTKDWYWDVNVNFSYNNNKITDIELSHTASSHTLYQITPNGSGQSGLPVKGKPLGRLYAYSYAGLDGNGQAQVYNKDGEILNYMAAMGYDPGLYKYMGTEIAPYYGSFGTNLSWKGLTLGLNFTYKFGHKMRAPLGNGPSYTLANGQSLSKGWKNIWLQPGDEAHTNVPVQMTGPADYFYSMFMDSFYIMADCNVLDASFLRLKDVHLDYRLPASFSKKLGIRGAIVKFQVQNIHTWVANDWGFDPEYYSVVQSGMASAYSLEFPNPTIYTLGFNIEF